MITTIAMPDSGLILTIVISMTSVQQLINDIVFIMIAA
jgi:hypothetical protein